MILTMQGFSPGRLWSMLRTQRLVCHHFKPMYTNTFNKCTSSSWSRGSQMLSKIACTSSGTTGSPIQLTANFFRILSRPEWVLYQYHVDYKPPMESRRLRSALLFQHEEALGSVRSFDGAVLFLPCRLPNKVI